MFKALQELAQKSTLMIILTTEGDLLRLNISPAPSDENKKPTLRPLSLLGTAEELDAGLAEAIAIWQAPRKSLAEQAQDSGGVDDDNDDGDNNSPPARTTPAKNKPAKEPKKAKSTPAAPVANQSVVLASKPWPFPTGDAPGTSTTANAASTDAPPLDGTALPDPGPQDTPPDPLGPPAAPTTEAPFTLDLY
jgi:PRTRC genetic system protein E